ncbi:MAG TPA: 30S ribosome-binding factor RbfA [Alphaproteobacteria bacterium]|nr:30S ribosome-binding factor RbfA [Alphaproteobacteria bacterium]
MFRSKKPSDSKHNRTPRQLKVGEELRHALAASLQRGDFPWTHESPRPVITVTEVRISPDLRNATIFVMPLGGTQVKEAVSQLNQHNHFFKNVIAQNVQMRWIPQLHFLADESFAYAEKIEKILHDPNVARDLEDHEEN